VEQYEARCAFVNDYEEVGYGWCRPVVPWVNAGILATYSECANACTAATISCRSFAQTDAGACALYAQGATNSSGESGVRCFTRR